MQDISATKGFVTAYRICSSRLIRKLPQYRLNPFLQAASNSARLYAQQGRNLVGSLNLEARILLTLGIGTQKWKKCKNTVVTSQIMEKCTKFFAVIALGKHLRGTALRSKILLSLSTSQHEIK